MKRSATGLFSLLILLALLAAPASAQDKKTQRIYDRIAKLQESGKHDRALAMLDKSFAEGLTEQARLLKVKSLVATSETKAAFALLVEVKDSSDSIKNELAAVALKLPKHPVKVTSTPEGADVFVDGKKVGTAGGNFELVPGWHTIELMKKGYARQKQTIFVDPAKAAFMSATLAARVGSVQITVDQEGLKARLNGQTTALGKGTTKIESVQAGKHKVEFVNAKGETVHTANIDVPAGGGTTASFAKFGVIRPSSKGATLELIPAEDAAKKEGPEDAEKEKNELLLEPGTYTVVLREPGNYPVKGTINVKAGQDQTLVVEGEAIPDRSGWEIASVVGVSLSLAMIATATILELSDVPESDGVGPTKFALAGVGGALFIASGGVLKWVRTEKSAPTAKEGTFKIQLGATPINGGAMLGAGGTF